MEHSRTYDAYLLVKHRCRLLRLSLRLLRLLSLLLWRVLARCNLGLLCLLLRGLNGLGGKLLLLLLSRVLGLGLLGERLVSLLWQSKQRNAVQELTPRN